MQMTAAANTLIPSILLLRQLGYIVTIDNAKSEVSAEKDGHRFTAGEPLTVLGLITLYENRGEHWQASDQEIEALLHDLA